MYRHGAQPQEILYKPKYRSLHRIRSVSVPQFNQFFHAATGHSQPFDYQYSLACGDRGDPSEEEWLRSGTAC
jgi:hypothetical protein